MKGLAVVFLSVFVAELGDKTQLATLLFAANPELSRVGVFMAASAALMLTSLLAVLLGGQISRFVPDRAIEIAAGLGFVAIGAWMLLGRGR